MISLPNPPMTHYDLLIDSIVDEIYYVWTEVSDWDHEETQETVRETAHRILQHVEEFQQKQSQLNKKASNNWRASD